MHVLTQAIVSRVESNLPTLCENQRSHDFYYGTRFAHGDSFSADIFFCSFKYRTPLFYLPIVHTLFLVLIVSLSIEVIFYSRDSKFLFH